MNVKYRMKKEFNNRITKYGPTEGVHRWNVDSCATAYLRDLRAKYLKKYGKYFNENKPYISHDDSIIAPYKNIMNDFNKLLCKGKMCDRYVYYGKGCKDII